MAGLRLCSEKSKIFDKNFLKNPSKICKYSPTGTPKFGVRGSCFKSDNLTGHL